jgi:hypothetical protein
MGLDLTLTSNLKEITAEIEKQIEERLTMASFVVHGQVVKDLSGVKSGREYPVPGTGKVVDKEKKLANGRIFHYRKLVGATYYTASAPGEAPAVRLGDLRTDYKAKVEGKGMNAVGLVGSHLDYSVYLEKGTSEIYPRPHLLPAMQKMKPKIIKLFEGLI